MTAAQIGENRISSISFSVLKLSPRNVYNYPCKREQSQQVGKLTIGQEMFIKTQLFVQNSTEWDIKHNPPPPWGLSIERGMLENNIKAFRQKNNCFNY